ncbi:MAG: MgtC/SapB family protein [Candidatus Omnitrophica bacterium]|nr:MgtC/SapB family protein [Candidatus Omnitrophota bacterium]
MISDVEVMFRLILATVFSGLIGLEREVSGRAAGFRTHILVCVGSALIMLTGIHLFEQYKGIAQVDPTRLAAQVVSGIGFLGAGTIIQYHDSVRGLTTAASLWAAAGIGLAVGSGFYLGALFSTGVVLGVLFFLSQVERRIVRSKRKPQD